MCAERRTNHLFLYDTGGSRHTTGLQRVGKVLGILDGEVTGDGRLTTVDLAVDTGSGIDNAVEDNGDSLAHIGLGQGSPTAGTLGVHAHAHLRSTCIVVELVGGIGNDITLQRSAARGAGHL